MAEALEEGVEQWEVRLGSGRQGPYQSLADNRKKHLRVETGKAIKRILQVMRNDDNLAELVEAEIIFKSM